VSPSEQPPLKWLFVLHKLQRAENPCEHRGKLGSPATHWNALLSGATNSKSLYSACHNARSAWPGRLLWATDTSISATQQLEGSFQAVLGGMG